MAVHNHGRVLCVGSFPLDSPEETFSTVGPALKGLAKRIPDGEPQGWINFASDVLERTKGIERYLGEPNPARPYMDPVTLKKVLIANKNPRPRYRIAAGYAMSDINFAAIGYDEIAIKSYAAFCAAREKGQIAQSTRFQVSFPTPFAVLFPVFDGDLPALLQRYEERLFQELKNITSRIPADNLAVQWDIALEMLAVIERKYMPEAAARFSVDDIVRFLVRVCAAVPLGVELGIHLCYGSPAGKHVVEPADAGNMVLLSNKFFAAAPRPINWLHIPVPISRNDDAYFAPLKDLALPAETEFYLGLVHPSDGVEGAKRRIDAARKAVTHFGVGTECGMRSFTDESFDSLLGLHRQVAALV